MAVNRRTVRAGGDEVALLREEIARLFDRLGGVDQAARGPAPTEWSPSVDVFECSGTLRVVVEVPGLVLDALKVTYRDGHLTISGERRDRRPAGALGFLCMERAHGRFRRSVFLDLPLDVRGAEAYLGNGLLEVRIPRLKERRGRETDIPIRRERPD
jgi:HSP20 family protein